MKDQESNPRPHTPRPATPTFLILDPRASEDDILSTWGRWIFECHMAMQGIGRHHATQYLQSLQLSGGKITPRPPPLQARPAHISPLYNPLPVHLSGGMLIRGRGGGGVLEVLHADVSDATQEFRLGGPTVQALLAVHVQVLPLVAADAQEQSQQLLVFLRQLGSHGVHCGCCLAEQSSRGSFGVETCRAVSRLGFSAFMKSCSGK